MKQHPILFSTAMVQAILEGRKTQTRRIIKPQPDEDFSGNLEAGVFNIGAYDQNGDLQEGPESFGAISDDGEYCIKFPYGQVGDVLWVREEHYKVGFWIIEGLTKNGNQKWKFIPCKNPVQYFNNPPDHFEKSRLRDEPTAITWYKRLARYMFRADCRLFLKITDIRVERLQDISEEDAIAEGGRFTDNGICESWPKNISYGQAKSTGGLKAGWSHVGETHPDKCLRSARSSFENIWQSINGAESWDANPFVWVISLQRTEAPSTHQ